MPGFHVCKLVFFFSCFNGKLVTPSCETNFSAPEILWLADALDCKADYQLILDGGWGGGKKYRNSLSS